MFPQFLSKKSFYTSIKGSKGFYYPVMTPIFNLYGLLLEERCEYYSGLNLQAYKISEEEMKLYNLSNNIIWISNDNDNRIRT